MGKIRELIRTGKLITGCQAALRPWSSCDWSLEDPLLQIWAWGRQEGNLGSGRRIMPLNTGDGAFLGEEGA